ncbi:NUDIX domain-containing protein [Candidatus Woesearchaeota archaeon]|nr:NUDIX domain-containing protein [Candidatus Woesearchaeota archaeon]
MKNTLHVASAIIRDPSDLSKILLIERTPGTPLIFPGGKKEEGETLDGTLQRELKEELGITLLGWTRFREYNNVGKPIFDAKYDDLTLHLFLVESYNGLPSPKDGIHNAIYVNNHDWEKNLVIVADMVPEIYEDLHNHDIIASKN